MALEKVSGCVLMVVCLVAMAHAFSFDKVEEITIDDSSENDLETVQLDDTMASMEDLEKLFDGIEKKGCFRCRRLRCQCCRSVRIPKTGLIVRGCLIVTYRPNTGTVIIQVKAFGRVVFKNEFAASEPRVIFCEKVRGANVCLEFFNLRVDKRTFTGCARVTYNKKVIIRPECFRINFLDSSMLFQSAESPVVDVASIIENSDGSFYMAKANFDEEAQAMNENNAI